MFPLNDEVKTDATRYKTEMLKIAHNCYIKASECDSEEGEEEWLHHYMLGKVAEKLCKPPQEALEHYRKVK